MQSGAHGRNGRSWWSQLEFYSQPYSHDIVKTVKAWQQIATFVNLESLTEIIEMVEIVVLQTFHVVQY